MKTPSELKICKGTIIPPESGWKDKTYYIVEIAFSKCNIIHKVIFYSGFVVNSVPSGYNCLFSPKYDENYTISDVFYMKAVKELDIDLEN